MDTSHWGCYWDINQSHTPSPYNIYIQNPLNRVSRFWYNFSINHCFRQHPQAGFILHAIAIWTNTRRQGPFYRKSCFYQHPQAGSILQEIMILPTPAGRVHFTGNHAFTNTPRQGPLDGKSCFYQHPQAGSLFQNLVLTKWTGSPYSRLSLTHFIYSYPTILSGKIDHPSTTLCDLDATQHFWGFQKSTSSTVSCP